MKKSQMELMGLAIVVILLSLVLLFVIKFVILREPTNQTKEYSDSELAANFLNALLETNSPECSDAKFSTLFQDCANNYDQGMGGEIFCGNGMNSCQYIKLTVGDLLDRSFGVWNIPYYFISYLDPNNQESTKLFGEYPPFGTKCTGDRRVKIQPLPLAQQGNLFLALYICE